MVNNHIIVGSIINVNHGYITNNTRWSRWRMDSWNTWATQCHKATIWEPWDFGVGLFHKVSHTTELVIPTVYQNSPPARWGLLDFMSVASSSCRLLPPASSSSSLSSLSSSSTASIHAKCSLPDLNHDHPRRVFPAGPQPRPSTPSVPCRTSTASIHAQCSLPDLNREYPCQVFPAGPQPRPSTPSVPCRTSTASIHAKCSLPDLM